MKVEPVYLYFVYYVIEQMYQKTRWWIEEIGRYKTG